MAKRATAVYTLRRLFYRRCTPATNHGCRYFPHLGSLSPPLPATLGRAFHLSAIFEPPLQSTVVERPCTVVLMEDESLYPNLWRHDFQALVPRDYGMSFASINEGTGQGSNNVSIDADAVTSDRTDSMGSFSRRLEILKTTLPPINDAVLVSRGPLSSLCAQYYLESFSLQGLVMVDPILLDQRGIDTGADDAAQLLQKSMLAAGVVQSEQELRHFHCDNLLLERNAVPMLVLLSIPDRAWNLAAVKQVAERHSDEQGPFGVVPVVNLAMELSERRDNDGSTGHVDRMGAANCGGSDGKEALHIIEKWIDEIL